MGQQRNTVWVKGVKFVSDNLQEIPHKFQFRKNGEHVYKKAKRTEDSRNIMMEVENGG